MRRMLQTIAWTGSAVRLLDQTKLPTQTVYVDITDEKQMWDAIKRLVVRGAPAIGVAAAFGVYLGVREFPEDNAGRLLDRVREVHDYLATSRPTAVNLFWALGRIKEVAATVYGHSGPYAAPEHHRQVVHDIKASILGEAQAMLEEDNRVCRAIGEHGMKLFEPLAKEDAKGEVNLLTHCNAG